MLRQPILLQLRHHTRRVTAIIASIASSTGCRTGFARQCAGCGVPARGGVFGFLPVLGFWMFPLGLVLLADDVPPLTGCGRGFSTGSNAAIPNGSHRTADRSHAVSFARSAAACTITLMRYSGGCAPVTTRLKSKMKVGTPSMPASLAELPALVMRS